VGRQKRLTVPPLWVRPPPPPPPHTHTNAHMETCVRLLIMWHGSLLPVKRADCIAELDWSPGVLPEAEGEVAGTAREVLNTNIIPTWDHPQPRTFLLACIS